MIVSLDIRLLGPFEVLAGGQPASVNGSKRHGLLAVLALRRGHVVSVETLIEALWGEELPAAPRNAIQHHVARLRAALGHEAIVASSDGYALTEATVDALRFQELLDEARVALREGEARAGAAAVARALALWRGPALQGLTDTTWFNGEARRLEALRVDALEEQFEAALALGEHREVVSAVRAALDDTPFRERLWGQLMLALYRCGRQADALEAFQEARRVLSEELGLEPGPDLRRLQDAILAHDSAIAPARLAPKPRGNLPTPSTSFVDREEALTEVVELLREHRLVTLTGPPGVGKSRLALEAARSLAHEVRDGVWLVELKDANEPADVARLVARVLEARGADPLARVVARLRDADAILVLDGCWRVVEEAARVASAVLAECPGVRLLATSRLVLHAPGEVRVTVQPLALPDAGRGAAAGAPAVQLFAERARAARPGFALTEENASLVAEITWHVDGLPLAIELAAARADVLGVAEILSLVENHQTLLSGGARSDATRTALATLVEWSYDLLHADEKTLLHQVAVHRGGASLPSLVALGARHGADEATVAYLLGALADKSIVLVSFTDVDARYDVLDTVRDYARERLAEADGLAATRHAHAEHFATLADEAQCGLRGRDWRAGVQRLEQEHQNLWAALDYARDAPDPAIALRLAALGWYFVLADRASEGRRFLELALETAADAPPEQLIDPLVYLCYLQTEELDLETAIATGERALGLGVSDRAPVGTGLAAAVLAVAVAESGDIERAAALSSEAHGMLESAGDAWALAAASLLRAQIAAFAGDVSSVAAMAAVAERQAAAIDFDAFAVPVALLEAWLAEQRRDLEAAGDAYGRALELAGRMGLADHAAFALVGLGAIASAAGDTRRAEDLVRHALATAEATQAAWVAAHARVLLGRILAAAGEAETAQRLYRDVVEWAERPRAHGARESLFLALAPNPAKGALLGLIELAEARGDGETAADLRGRVGLAVA